MARKTKNSHQKETKEGIGKRWIILSAVLVLIMILGLVFAGVFTQPAAKFSLTAAIIDQLGTDFPNPSFVSDVTRTMEDHGFNVTYYNQTLNVAFFSNLASSNYGLIILREHSALRSDNSTVDLLTSEKYDESSAPKHASQLNSGLLTVGEFYYKPGEQFFALSSLFIENLAGRFPNSIIIAMGCQSLKQGCEQIAQAFLDKGAKAFIGWSDIVIPRDTDAETLNLLHMLLNENMTIDESVSSTNPHAYSGQPFPNSTYTTTVISRMRFYPQSNGNLTISQLIAQSKPPTASSSLLSAASLLICPALTEPGAGLRSRRKVWLCNQFLVTP